ncbi:hypothetical protein PG984_015147 [Apiospora sp. TS-2023a]
MIWIPQIKQFSFQTCVGANAGQVKFMLDQAEKFICRRDLVLAYGVLPNNGHKARAGALLKSSSSCSIQPIAWPPRPSSRRQLSIPAFRFSTVGGDFR